MKNHTMTRFLAAGAVFIEWIEFSIYLYMSTIFSVLFFPAENPSLNMIMMYAIFAMSYFVRPLGAIAYGYIADKTGRKRVMLFSVLLMSIATLGIGILPTYQEIGLLAPLLLLLCRMFQSFAVSVEFNTSAIYLIENTEKHPIIAASWLPTASGAGMGIGAFLVSQLDLERYPQGWRWPFLGASVLSFLIFFLRQRLQESPAFLEALANDALSKNPFKEAWRDYRKQMVVIASLAAFLGVFLYGGHVYFVTFLVQQGQYSLSEATRFASLTELGVAVLTPCMAFICQHWGYRLPLKGSIILMAIVGPWVFMAGSFPDKFMELSCAIFLYTVADALFSACIFYYMYTLLPVQLRCTATGMAWSIPMAVFGGTAPLISAALVAQGYKIGPGLYIMAMGLMVFLVVSWYDAKANLSGNP